MPSVLTHSTPLSRPMQTLPLPYYLQLISLYTPFLTPDFISASHFAEHLLFYFHSLLLPFAISFVPGINALLFWFLISQWRSSIFVVLILGHDAVLILEGDLSDLLYLAALI